MSRLAPITLFVYNRPDHTRRTLECLMKNILADQSELFIYADSGKSDASSSEVNQISEVRKIIREKKWCKNVHIIESAENKGLANSIISGVTEVVNRFGKIIVLEDDMETSKWYLKFMNDFLEMYEPYEEVISATGFIYPVKRKMPETFFLKGTFCWGWATWKRGWALFEPDGKKLLNELTEKNLTGEFDFNESYNYTEMLRDQVEARNDSWALRWYAAAFLKNKLTLLPGQSLIQNIGLDGTGIHCGVSDDWIVEIKPGPVKVYLLERREDLESKKAIGEFFKLLKRNRTVVKAKKPQGIVKRLNKKLVKYFGKNAG